MNKICTDIEQSKKLAEILPPESADMFYCYGMDIHTKKWDYDIVPTIIDTSNQIDIGDIPCWGLAALFNYLRDIDFFPEIDVDEHDVTMNIYYYNEEEAKLIAPIHSIRVKAEDFIDACYEMILKLHELNLL